jgi:cytochrome d ubiquinol oxidase subunit I
VLAGLAIAHYKRMRLTDGVKRLMCVLAVGALLTQVVIAILGDMSMRYLSSSEPNKFAALELIQHTGDDQSFQVGGRFNSDTQKVEGAIAIPHMLSVMTGFSTTTSLKGLDEIPQDKQPLTIIHTLFEIKMGLTMCVVLLTAISAWGTWKRKEWMYGKYTTHALVFGTIASIILVELGWMLTELGRQPYAIQGFLTTAEAFVGDPRVMQWGMIFPGLFVLLFASMIMGVRNILKKEV